MDEKWQDMKNQMEKMMGMIRELQDRQPAAERSGRLIRLPVDKKPDPSDKKKMLKELFPGKTDPRLVDSLVDCMEETEKEGVSGKVKIACHFQSGGADETREYNRILDVDTDRLLALITEGWAEKVLNCVGSHERLNMLLALLKQPMNVSQMMETLRLNSTGQAYHHLKALINAALVAEDKETRGVYYVDFHRVSGVLILLAGVYDLMEDEYTKGKWE